MRSRLLAAPAALAASPAVLSLTQGAISEMTLNKLRVAMLTAAVGLSAAGLGVGGWAIAAGDGPKPTADKKAEMMSLVRKGGLGLLVAVLLLVVWLKGRRRNKARQQATSLVVEQLRQDQAQRLAASQQAAALEQSPATVALQRAEHDESAEVRDELAALVERQPEDVAALLRGWLVER